MNEVFILPFIVYVLSKSLTDASHQSSTVPYARFILVVLDFAKPQVLYRPDFFNIHCFAK